MTQTTEWAFCLSHEERQFVSHPICLQIGTAFATLDNDECLMINESNIYVILNEGEGSRKVSDKVRANERMQIHLQFSASAAELNNKL